MRKVTRRSQKGTNLPNRIAQLRSWASVGRFERLCSPSDPRMSVLSQRRSLFPRLGISPRGPFKLMADNPLNDQGEGQ